MKLDMPNHSLSVRGAGIFCGLVFLLPRAPTVGGQADAPLSRQTVNRTVPAHRPPVAGWSLPANPSAEEIRDVRMFVEPLVPTGAVSSAEENRLMAEALHAHFSRAVVDDFSDLEQFAANYPASPWTPSLTFNLGMEYYQTGWYSKALGAWERAWALLKDATEPAAKALGDRAAGELALMYGRVARISDLSALLDSITNRVIAGSAEQEISTARLDLWAMKNRPEASYRCGPLALDRIRASRNFKSPADLLVYNARATTNGHSLVQLARLSWDLGLNYRMAAREKGAALLMPVVIHLKLGHYAALLEEEDGRWLLQDPTFGNTWVSRRVLEEESSGYFLVPSGGNLPGGWRPVSDAEGAAVWGKGPVKFQDTSATTPYDKCLPCWLSDLFSPVQAPPPGMAVATVSLMLVSLKLEDNPVGYQPPVGPSVRFVATCNQYESGQPANFSYSNLGQKWTFNWLAYITDNPSSPSSDVTYYTDGGGTLAFTYDSHARAFAPEVKSQTLLTRTTPNSYVLLHPDGSQYVFSQPTATNGTSRNVFMTQVVDPRGNSVRISYDSRFRVIALTDAIGQVTVLSYTDAADPLKITGVTDPFGRSATFRYNAVSKMLVQITDCIGLTSQFDYYSATSLAMTTPYGTTSFACGNPGIGGPNPWLVVTHPDGEKERYEFTQSSTVGTPHWLPGSAVPKGATNVNEYLDDRNTYYWDRNAYPAYLANTNDYTTARVYHWLHSGDGTASSGVAESEQAPLEGRVWFLYAGQPDPIHIGASSQPTVVARVLDDGSTQLRTAAYNALGRVTRSVDPVGRSMTYLYSTNLVDLLEVRQTTGTNDDLIGRFLYNSQHLPTAVFDAAGQMTTNTYNARGELLTSTDPKGETTTMTYDSNGYLLSIVGPLGPAIDTVSFSYDAVGRVRSHTDTDGYTLTYGYDDLDRLTNTTFPDGTFEVVSYTNLDLGLFQDRLGRQTTHTYDSLRQLVATQDPLGRVTRYKYCGCGSLSGIIDPLGRET
ncbi:MAG TPA: cysteine peptidase family C39 domain-containing protein, partial [Dongiaceae bacterium]|nr:cysteine peptidase family C39 domain-containing protein [Dongiaceae bacterium]